MSNRIKEFTKKILLTGQVEELLKEFLEYENEKILRCNSCGQRLQRSTYCHIVPCQKCLKEKIDDLKSTSMDIILNMYNQNKKDFYCAMNLLCRIHRDGGQHSQKVGNAQSCADAEKIIINMKRLFDIVRRGIPEKPDHDCANPDAPCDSDCVEWGDFCGLLAEIPR